MAVSERTQKYILNQYAAHWFHMTPAMGLNGWIEWFEMDSTDEWCVNEAFRRIVEERMDSERFSSKDTLKLTEMQHVYRRVKREIKNKNDAEDIRDRPCDYCKDQGFRYIVVHSHGPKITESMIKKVPESIGAIRSMCYHYTLPCTCTRGQRLYFSRKASCEKDHPGVRIIEPGRLTYILEKYSMLYLDAWKLVNDYRVFIILKYFPQKQESEEDKIRKRNFEAFQERALQNIARLEGKEKSTETVPF